MKKRDKFKEIYSKPNFAPWTFKKIPKEIKRIEKIIPKNSKILEIGCGEGHHAIHLAKKGFNVTAIDFSKNAITFAKQKIRDNKIKFIQKDFSEISKYKNKFNFIFDWRFLHEIKDKNQRKKYIKSVSNALKKDGQYLSVAFSGDSSFMGEGILRTSPVGIKIYFSTLKESCELIGQYLHIIESKHITIPQKPNLKILANYILSKKA